MKLMVLFISIIFSLGASAQGGGHGRNRQYRDVFHYLLEQHQSIDRNVELVSDGVRTITTSSDAVVERFLKKHVAQMKGLVESGRRIRNWDPLFSAIFDNHHLIEMKVKSVPGGVEVFETSHDPFVAKLIKEHAKVVSLFVQFGFDEAHRSHSVPSQH